MGPGRTKMSSQMCRPMPEDKCENTQMMYSCEFSDYIDRLRGAFANISVSGSQMMIHSKQDWKRQWPAIQDLFPRQIWLTGVRARPHSSISPNVSAAIALAQCKTRQRPVRACAIPPCSGAIPSRLTATAMHLNLMYAWSAHSHVARASTAGNHSTHSRS